MQISFLGQSLLTRGICHDFTDKQNCQVSIFALVCFFFVKKHFPKNLHEIRVIVPEIFRNVILAEIESSFTLCLGSQVFYAYPMADEEFSKNSLKEFVETGLKLY